MASLAFSALIFLIQMLFSQSDSSFRLKVICGAGDYGSTGASSCSQCASDLVSGFGFSTCVSYSGQSYNKIDINFIGGNAPANSVGSEISLKQLSYDCSEHLYNQTCLGYNKDGFLKYKLVSPKVDTNANLYIPQTSSTSYFLQLPSIDTSQGQDLETIATEADFCSPFCRSNPACVAYVHSSSRKTCWLKSSFTSTTLTDLATSLYIPLSVSSCPVGTLLMEYSSSFPHITTLCVYPENCPPGFYSAPQSGTCTLCEDGLVSGYFAESCSVYNGRGYATIPSFDFNGGDSPDFNIGYKTSIGTDISKDQFYYDCTNNEYAPTSNCIAVNSLGFFKYKLVSPTYSSAIDIYVPRPTSTSLFLQLYGFDTSSADLNVYTSTSAANCAIHCKENVACVGFVHTTVNNECWIKDAYNSPFTSGVQVGKSLYIPLDMTSCPEDSVLVNSTLCLYSCRPGFYSLTGLFPCTACNAGYVSGMQAVSCILDEFSSQFLVIPDFDFPSNDFDSVRFVNSPAVSPAQLAYDCLNNLYDESHICHGYNLGYFKFALTSPKIDSNYDFYVMKPTINSLFLQLKSFNTNVNVNSQKIANTTAHICALSCKSDSSCVGFVHDSTSNECALKDTYTSPVAATSAIAMYTPIRTATCPTGTRLIESTIICVYSCPNGYSSNTEGFCLSLSKQPSIAPSISKIPTMTPTLSQSPSISLKPSFKPSFKPSIAPTLLPPPGLPKKLICKSGQYFNRISGGTGNTLDYLTVTCSDGYAYGIMGTTVISTPVYHPHNLLHSK